MITPLLQKIMIVFVAILFIAYLGYGLVNVTPKPQISESSIDMDAKSQEILTTVDQLNKISFDSSIFSSPLFTSLVDFTVMINTELVGRPNPFLPIGAELSTSQTVQSSSASKKSSN